MTTVDPSCCSYFLRIVIQHSPSLSIGQLVCVAQYHPPLNGVPQIGPALAVGRMALPGDQISETGKGKAVNIFHTWKDHLWEMGGKDQPPPPRAIEINAEANDEGPSNRDPTSTIESASKNIGEASSQAQDGLPPATFQKEETNPLSQQGIHRINCV